MVIVPLMGAWHLKYPQYNAVSVREVVAAAKPEALALTPLAEGALADPCWQDTPEIALPLSVIPWAKRRGLPLYPIFEPSPDAQAQADFYRYAEQYPQLRARLAAVEAELAPLPALLQEALTLPRILDEVLPLLRRYQLAREQQLEEGPATDWWRSRAARMAERILALPQARVAVLASAEHIPLLEAALAPHAQLSPPTPPPASEEGRIRSLLDYAFYAEAAESGALIAQLKTLKLPEARYHEANLLFASGHLAEALERLREASRQDFSEPYYLPGFLLARLGQLYDLAGQRQQALRCYRGVLALTYAPPAALEAAEAGLKAPFALPPTPP